MSENNETLEPQPSKPNEVNASNAIGLYRLKSRFSKALSPILNLAVRKSLSPNLFTIIGVFGGVIMGFGLAVKLPFWVLIGLIIRFAGANLDGAVARARKLPLTAKGFLNNEIGDRLADWFALSAFLSYQGVSVIAVIATMVLTTLPTMVSLVGVSQGKPRLNGGPVGKVERCFLLLLMTIFFQLGFDIADTSALFMAILSAGSIITAIYRRIKLSGL
jgi:CDP-diacylglycerol--glycerol-3-phosphate 3-phosphatidyltransferase